MEKSIWKLFRKSNIVFLNDETIKCRYTRETKCLLTNIYTLKLKIENWDEDNGILILTANPNDFEWQNVPTISKPKRYFVLRHANCCAYDGDGKKFSDIIGITDDEEIAKSNMSVFCYYEEVNFLNK